MLHVRTAYIDQLVLNYSKKVPFFEAVCDVTLKINNCQPT
jgi:hypothetical protein